MVSNEVRSSIVDRIRATTVRSDVVISDSTELYEELRIWGDDFHELIDWIAVTYGVDFRSMNASKYVPAEGLGEIVIGRVVTGKSPFLSCTLGKILAAVERGRWEDA